MKNITKKYTNGEVTVVWKPDLCIHSRICFTGLAEVFDPRKRPWVTLEKSTTDKIIEQVKKCPSAALSYYLDRDADVEVSHYSGEDILDLFRDRNNDGRGFLSTYASGNSSQSLKWTRDHMRRWISDLSLTRTAYQYNIRNIFEENSLVAFSDIEDYSTHLSFAKDSIWKNAAVKTGASITRHCISPNIINSTGSIAELLESSSTSGKIAHEIALFGASGMFTGYRVQFPNER